MRILPETREESRNAAAGVRRFGIVGFVLSAIMGLAGILLYLASWLLRGAFAHSGSPTWAGVHGAAGVAFVALGTVLGIRTPVVLLNLWLLVLVVVAGFLTFLGIAASVFWIIPTVVVFTLLAILFLRCCLLTIRAWPSFGSFIVRPCLPSYLDIPRRSYAIRFALVTTGLFVFSWWSLRGFYYGNLIADLRYPVIASITLLAVVVELGGGWIAARMRRRWTRVNGQITPANNTPEVFVNPQTGRRNPQRERSHGKTRSSKRVG